MGLKERWENSSWLTRFVIVWLIPAGSVVIAAVSNISTLANAYEAWDAAGFPTVAMRNYVRERVQPVQVTLGQTTQQVKDLQLDIALGKRESYDNEKAKWQLELNKAQDDTTRSLALQQIERINRTNEAINEQIKALRGSRGPQ